MEIYAKVYKSYVQNAKKTLEESFTIDETLKKVKDSTEYTIKKVQEGLQTIEREEKVNFWDFGKKAFNLFNSGDCVLIIMGNKSYLTKILGKFKEPTGNFGDKLGWARQYEKPWENIFVLKVLKERENLSKEEVEQIEKLGHYVPGQKNIIRLDNIDSLLESEIFGDCFSLSEQYNKTEEFEIKQETNMYNSKTNIFLNLKLPSYTINSFYNSLKTKGFVILAGLSGTGKTKIFEEFVKYFGDNHLFFPIRPDFKDTKSLLGFYNPLKNQYQSTPLLEFILKASSNYLEKGKEADPFFILFDEMNLARVEYYFADFLSVLETKKFENKDNALEKDKFREFISKLGNFEINENNYKFTSQSIKLHSEGTEEKPEELFLPPNLYFLGTVNIDETTHIFSPKVLDRAFTIEFDVEDFENYIEFLNSDNSKENINIPNLKEDFINNGEFSDIQKKKIKEFFDSEEHKKYLEKLNEINGTLKGYNLHFGYRVFDEIAMFLYNSENSIFKFENLDEAFDLAIKMKILPKFHGTRQRLEEPIIEFLKLLDLKPKQTENNEQSLIKDIRENLKGIPAIENNLLKVKLRDKEILVNTDFIHTTHKLLEMLYKLKSQGFASFV